MAFRVEESQSLFTRLFHWSLAIIVLGKIITGLYLTYPVGDGGLMALARRLHFLAIYPMVFLLLARVYYGWITGDWKDIILVPRDLPALKGLFRYLFFLRERPPLHAKYNVGQKGLFTSWFLVLTGLIITGFILYAPETRWHNSFFIFDLHGARISHYFLTLWLLFTVPGHIYFALTEDIGRFQAMLTGRIRREIGPPPPTAGAKPEE